MSLKELWLTSSIRDDKTMQATFNHQAWCISQMYFRFMGKYETGKTRRVILVLSDWKSYSEEFFGQIYSRTTPFTFIQYFNSENSVRKKILLNTLHDNFRLLASQNAWNLEQLETAYQTSLKNKLSNVWVLHNKYYRSPARIKYACIECNWDIDMFSITVVFFDSNKKEIARTKVVDVLPANGIDIYNTSGNWLNELVFTVFFGQQSFLVTIP